MTETFKLLDHIPYTTTLVIELPIPHGCLNPNSSANRFVKAKHKADSRITAKLTLLSLFNRMKKEFEPWDHAVLQPVFYYPTKRRRDRDNCGALLKSTYDGLCDAGLTHDDVQFYPLPPIIRHDKENPRVVITMVKPDIDLTDA